MSMLLTKGYKMEDSKNRRDFFLSHSSKDKNIVKNIANILKEKGINVWLDEWDIEPGGNIVKEINSGLENSLFVLVFLSNKSVKSKWVEEEWTKKVYEEIDVDTIKVIPVIIDEMSPNLIPLILRGKKYLNFTNNNFDEIDKLVDIVKQTHKSEVEKSELSELKDIISEAITKDGLKVNFYDHLLNKLDIIKEWNINKKLILIKNEIEFEIDQETIREIESKNDYENNPSKLSFWKSVASWRSKGLRYLNDKVNHIINSEIEDEDKLSLILLEIEIMASKNN